MRECALCGAEADDYEERCPRCGADLSVDSVRAHALKHIRESPRATHVFVVAPSRACPVCMRGQGSWPKDSDQLPSLPHEGCSCLHGCRCRYEPLVVEVGP